MNLALCLGLSLGLSLGATSAASSRSSSHAPLMPQYWDYLGPFTMGKNEWDGDPVAAAYGSILNVRVETCRRRRRRH